MPAWVDLNWSYRGLKAVILENEFLRAVVLPELGGRLWELHHKPSDFQFLWHHPRIAPRPVPFGSNYDNHWFGGWDELFPNDAPCTVEGEELPDHGEVWSIPWEYDVPSSDRRCEEVRLILRCETLITACQLEKELVLRAGEPNLTVLYRLANPTGKSVPFLWKLHLALKVEPLSRIQLPPCTVIPEPAFCSRFASEPAMFPWPFAPALDGGQVDLRVVPEPTAAATDFFYALGLADGWFALCHPNRQLRLAVRFPKEVFSTVWVFATYGGWRDLYALILEPCTAYPYLLDEAIRQGTASVLRAGERVEALVQATVQTGEAALREETI